MWNLGYELANYELYWFWVPWVFSCIMDLYLYTLITALAIKWMLMCRGIFNDYWYCQDIFIFRYLQSSVLCSFQFSLILLVSIFKLFMCTRLIILIRVFGLMKWAAVWFLYSIRCTAGRLGFHYGVSEIALLYCLWGFMGVNYVYRVYKLLLNFFKV